ncbi:sulfotransferase family protein [Methylobacterium sp. SyP6R]|uniref:sulfotransferase family protein n=1 Tax=Methylobacterium sp. SyP6R TaxID=2718876 RepID=UPI001F330306|nr:sulfotransferase [Methylobacterium sp. SyP6R]MCF4125524.1 sulfotransferase [Methylobacterium sp. SyP6R]
MTKIEYVDYISAKIFPPQTPRFSFSLSSRVLKSLSSSLDRDVVVFSIVSDKLIEICKNDANIKIYWRIIQGNSILDKRIFSNNYNIHQILLNRNLICGGSEFAMEFEFCGGPLDEAFDLKIDVGVGNFSAIVEELEEKYIWIFGSPRAGTTWLAHDILGAIPAFNKQKGGLETGYRPIDEMNIGRILGAFEVEPEHYMYLDSKIFASYEDDFPSSPHFDQEKIRGSVFKRTMIEGYQRHESIFNERTHDMLIESIRDIIFKHVMLHWGVEGYDRVVLKAPNEGHASDLLLRATPRSRAIHLVRDGRDVIRSRFSPFASRILAETQDVQLRRNAVGYYAHQWNWHTNVVRKACADHDGERVLTIRYEDLRIRDISVFRRVVSFAGYPADDRLLKDIINNSALEAFGDHQKGPDLPRQSGRVGGYRRVFDDVEKTTMTAIMADNLSFYGYDMRVAPSDLQLGGRGTETYEFDTVKVVCSEGFYNDRWLARRSAFILHAGKYITKITIEIYIIDELIDLYKEINLSLVIQGENFLWRVVESGVSRFDCEVKINENEIFKIKIAADKSHRPSSVRDSDDDRDICAILSNIVCG